MSVVFRKFDHQCEVSNSGGGVVFSDEAEYLVRFSGTDGHHDTASCNTIEEEEVVCSMEDIEHASPK